jgi:predicted DNA-binding transcriptional regulator AlpA
MDEIMALLDVGRRTIDRRIAKKKFPAPVKYGANKIGFPLTDLVAWVEARSVTFAAEVERLATTRTVDPRPDSIKKTLAKQLSRQWGEKFSVNQVLYGAVRDATADETAAIRAANFAKLDHYSKELFAELNFVESLMVAYGLFPALREMITAMNNVVSARMKLMRQSCRQTITPTTWRLQC